MELIVGAKKFSDKENPLVITKISIFCAHYEVVKLVLPNRDQVEKTLKAFFLFGFSCCDVAYNGSL